MTDIKESISQETINTVNELSEYKHGWTTDIDTDKIPKGLNEDTIRLISAKKNEPEWMLEWRLNAYKVMQTMKEPDWAKVDLPKIDMVQASKRIYEGRIKPKLADKLNRSYRTFNIKKMTSLQLLNYDFGPRLNRMLQGMDED